MNIERLFYRLVLFACLSIFIKTGQAQQYGLTERIPNTSLLISTAGDTLAEMDLVTVFDDLSFIQPVFLTSARDGSDRLFVVEKRGVIQVFQNQPDVQESSVFLDIVNQVSSEENEAGLLSMAFHPEFPDSNKFYINYNNLDLTTRISEFEVSADPDVANVSSQRILLEIEQPYRNHNGGQIAFGPDGFLYIGMGDGGSGGDPDGNGQNRSTLLGAMLRINVDSKTDSLNYGIPTDNPFYGNSSGWREEIWAWGLRNPWRFSCDRISGDLWAGETAIAIINIIDKY